jgi:N-acetylglucosamine kinase-like BadF-type ATPase
MDAHRAECTCCTPENACYFLASRVRYSNGMRCVLGFDGGGTKTDCVLMDETGGFLARSRSGPSNPILVGVDAAASALIEAAEKACVSVEASFADVKIVSGGVAGMGATSGSPLVVTQLQAKLPNALISIHSDVSMALAATAETPSIVAIAGTGSAIFGRNAAGATAREGGLGAMLGDPGSAYDIGRKAIVEEWHRLRAGEESLLRSEILEHFGCDWMGLQERILAKPAGVFPRVFPFVALAANRADEVARQLLRSSAEELATLGGRVITKLNLSADSFLFAKTGGVFDRSCYFDEAFDQRIRAFAQQVRLGGLPVPVAEFAARSALVGLSKSIRKAGS